MANRYWVNGSGNWTSTARWSTTSGGASGASVPSSNDTVYIDNNSFIGTGGAGTITLDTAFASCLNFIVYPSSPTISFLGLGSGTSSIICQGVYTNFGGLYFSGMGGITLDSSAYNLVRGITGGDFGAWNVVVKGFKSLGGPLSTTGSLSIGDGNSAYVPFTQNIFSASGYSITAQFISINGGYVDLADVYGVAVNATFSVNTLSTYPPTIVHSGAYHIQNSTQLTLGNSSSQRINLQESAASAPLVTISTVSGATVYIGTFAADKGTFQFAASKTFDVSSFTFSSATVKTFQSSSSGTQYTLLSGGPGDTRNFYNMSIRDSATSGATVWNAINSTNVGNNTGWNFISSGNNMLVFFT